MDDTKVVVDLSNIDFPAWREDREELRHLRQYQKRVHMENKMAAEYLQKEATKIEAACDAIDHMTAELGALAL